MASFIHIDNVEQTSLGGPKCGISTSEIGHFRKSAATAANGRFSAYLLWDVNTPIWWVHMPQYASPTPKWT